MPYRLLVMDIVSEVRIRLNNRLTDLSDHGEQRKLSTFYTPELGLRVLSSMTFPLNPL